MAGENADAAAGPEPVSPDNRPDAEAGWESDSSSVGKFPGADAAAADAAAGAGGDRREAAGGEGDEAAAEAARVERMRDGRGRFAKTGTAAGDVEAAKAAGDEPAKGKDAEAAKAAGADGGKDSPLAKRVKQLDAKRVRAEREAAGWRERALTLERQLQSRGGGGKAGAEGAAADGGRPDARGEAPKFKFPTWEQYSEKNPEATHEDYMDARDDARDEFKTSMRQTAQSRMSAQVEEEEVTRGYADRMTAYKAAHPEFEEALEANGEIPNSPAITHIAMLSERSGQILHTLVTHPNEARIFASLSMPRPVAEFIADSPIAESLMLHIGKHPTEFRELLDGGPVRGMRALVELEKDVQAARNPKGSASATSTPKRPSAPIRPVSAGGAAGSSADGNLDDMEFGPDWVQADNERDRRNGRRR